MSVSSIGYGDRYPKTPSGRDFCIVYALIGVPLTGYLISVLCSVFVRLVKRSAGFILRFRGKTTQQKSAEKTSRQDKKDEKMKEDKRKLEIHKFIRSVQALMATFVFLLFLWLLPSIIIMKAQDWDFETAVYFCFITISTIGLGDVTPAMSVDPLELNENDRGSSLKQVWLSFFEDPFSGSSFSLR